VTEEEHFVSSVTTNKPPRHQLVVWQILDDKPGHRNQVIGLAEALQRQTSARLFELPVTNEVRNVRCFLPRRCDTYSSLPTPDVLVAAGHATHLLLLRLRRQFGGRSVVLMKPSLPLRLFDQCFVPDTHEFRRTPTNVELTQGAINRIRPSHACESERGLILIGGPSQHFGWSDTHVLNQAMAVVKQQPTLQWTIATSRRTPESFLTEWNSRSLPGQLVPAKETTSNWLPAQLAQTTTAWVTADSVSMLYEAMTAGAAIGLLELPDSQHTRVTRAVESLVDRNQIVPYSRWRMGTQLIRNVVTLQEADRCAEFLLTRFFPCPQPASRAA
jgi:uncharacterized protein